MQINLWGWVIFFLIITALIIFDLGFVDKKNQHFDTKKSLLLSIFYISIALLFGLGIWMFYGGERAFEYYNAYLIEKTLSIDNIFLISMIFSHLSIPKQYQHRVLIFGIISVIIMRAIMIFLGAALLDKFDWIINIFGVILILSGIKMIININKKYNLQNNIIFKLFNNSLPTTTEIKDNSFFVWKPNPQNPQKQKLFLTPLFVALICIEFVDIIFAIDSIPAVLVLTNSKFIIYTSNIFAILGLRALYFCLSGILHNFRYLKYSLSMILIFIGSKIFIVSLLDLDKFPALVTFAITFGLLAAGILASIIIKPTNSKHNGQDSNGQPA